MHASRSIVAMKMGSTDVDDGHFKLFPFCAQNIIADKKSQQHLKDFPWEHCAEEFMRKQGSPLSSRATLSTSLHLTFGLFASPLSLPP